MTPQDLKDLAILTLTGSPDLRSVGGHHHEARATCKITGGYEGDAEGLMLFVVDAEKEQVEIRFRWFYWRNAEDWDYLGVMGLSCYDHLDLDGRSGPILKTLVIQPEPPEPEPVGWDEDPFEFERAWS